MKKLLALITLILIICSLLTGCKAPDVSMDSNGNLSIDYNPKDSKDEHKSFIEKMIQKIINN